MHAEKSTTFLKETSAFWIGSVVPICNVKPQLPIPFLHVSINQAHVFVVARPTVKFLTGIVVSVIKGMSRLA